MSRPEVLFCHRAEGDNDLQPLENRYGFAGGDRIPVTIGANGSWTLCNDPEILDLARRAHAALPDVPLLGIDIVRDKETGRLYVLETNPGGWTWGLSPATGRTCTISGSDLARQFDGVRRAARILVERARLEAR